MPNDVLTLAEQYRNELLLNDAKALGRLVRAYHGSFKMLIDKLELVIADLGNGHHTIGQVHRAERYKELITQVAEQLRDLQGLTRQELNTIANFGINLGSAHARGLIAATAGDERLAIAFNKLNPEAIKSLLGFLDPDGPLYKRLGELSRVGADRIAQDLTDALVAGYNPVKTADIFRRAWGMSLTDSMRMTRTVQIKAYQEANRATYIANNEVVIGWQWCASHDADTCCACLEMDGTIHDLDENMDGHYNCRCTDIPVVKGFPPILEEGSGETWFNEQPESIQRAALGPGKYDAWKNGDFILSDIVGIQNDPVYGDMRIEKPLWDLLGAEPPLRTK